MSEYNYLTSSKCSYPLVLYSQKHGSQGITDKHFPTLQKVQQYKKDQRKHPTLRESFIKFEYPSPEAGKNSAGQNHKNDLLVINQTNAGQTASIS